ncbi:MAG: DcrB-related protein [Deltaproteobacteria bacterium]|jgi:hypothetical protein
MATHSVESYELDLPEGWSTRLLTVMAPIEKVGFKNANYPVHIAIGLSSFKRGQSFEAWAQEQLDELEQQLKGVRILAQEPFTANGVEGQLAEYTHLSPDGQMLRQLIVFLPCGKKGLSASVGDLMGPRFDKMRPGYLEILESLRMKP